MTIIVWMAEHLWLPEGLRGIVCGSYGFYCASFWEFVRSKKRRIWYFPTLPSPRSQNMNLNSLLNQQRYHFFENGNNQHTVIKKILRSSRVMSSRLDHSKHFNILVVFHMLRWTFQVSISLARSLIRMCVYTSIHEIPSLGFFSGDVNVMRAERDTGVLEDFLLCT